MLRYRESSAGVTEKSKKAAALNLDKIGDVKEIRGYRFTSTRKIGNGSYNSEHECVLVKGTNGTARFQGFLWGYCGEGPRGLVQLLECCGLTQSAAEAVAYKTPRRMRDGIDWSIRFPVGVPINTNKITY
jgi:hypothetical protein